MSSEHFISQGTVENVNIYLRTYEKKALLVSIPKKLSYKQIKNIVQEKI